MRFAVTQSSEPRSAEVEDRIKRLRLIRVLSIVELIGLCCAIVWTVRLHLGALFLVDAVLAVMTVFIVVAIESRFVRYCRAIERSFLRITVMRLGPDSEATLPMARLAAEE
jgi:hypothetical protein